MGRLKQALNREQRAFGATLGLIPPPLFGVGSFAGPIVTDDTSLAHVDVWKCRSLLADSVGMLPLRAYKTTAWVDDNSQKRTYAERLPTQPLLFTDPMPGDVASEFNFKHRLVDSLTGTGNAYFEIAAVDTRGVPTAAFPIHPSLIREIRTNAAGHDEFVMHDGRIMGSVRHGGTMVHIPGYTQAGSRFGLSPIGAGKQAIALGMAAEEFGANWFGNGTAPSGYLQTANPVDEKEATALKRKWIQTYGGLNREPAVLYGGMEWHPISVPPEESQFIETRQFQSGQIAALYRIPPHLVGDVDKTTSWGTGIEEMGLGFVTYTLNPWLVRIEQAMSFLIPRGQFSRFTRDVLLQGRVEDRDKSFAAGREGGYRSVNDIRQTLDLPPVPGGDTYIQPLNYVDINAPQPDPAGPPAADSPPDEGPTQ